MKKWLQKTFPYLFKPKKHWAQEAYEAMMIDMARMQQEHAAEAEFDAAWLAAIEEEHILTAGRPVTLLQPSRTLH